MVNPSIEEVLKTSRIDDLPRRRISVVSPDTSLGDVYRQLGEERTVAVLVCDGEQLVGIFTERDVLNRTALEGDPATPIGDWMSDDVVTSSADARLVEAIRAMTAQKIRHLPLVDERGRATGLIGGRDILRLLAEHHPEALLNLPPRLHQTMDTEAGG